MASEDLGEEKWEEMRKVITREKAKREIARSGVLILWREPALVIRGRFEDLRGKKPNSFSFLLVTPPPVGLFFGDC